MKEFLDEFDFSKKSETLEYWNRLLPVLHDNKIKSIFTLYAPMWSYYDGHRTYYADTELYILFEDGMCLVINYLFIDSLELEYRLLSEEERITYNDVIIKDFMNSADEIYNTPGGVVIKVETIALGYDAIDSVTLNSVTYEYGKWIEHHIDYVEPTDETFDRLDIHMKNGKVISICPQDAESDGYVMIWSKDAIETIEYK